MSNFLLYYDNEDAGLTKLIDIPLPGDHEKLRREVQQFISDYDLEDYFGYGNNTDDSIQVYVIDLEQNAELYEYSKRVERIGVSKIPVRA